MNRFRYLLFIAVFLIALTAETGRAASEMPQAIFREEQKEEIRAAIREFLDSTSNLGMLPVDGFDVDQAFIQEICKEYIVETVQKQSSFFALKGEDEQVCVPSGSGEIRLRIKDGKVTVLGYSVSASGVAKGFNWNKLDRMLQKAGLSGTPEKVRVLKSTLYQAVFVCIQMDGKEYVAVINSMMDEAGIEDEKLYTTEELVSKMDAYYDEAATQKAIRIAWLNGEGGGAGGVLVRGTPLPSIHWLRPVLLAGVMVLCVVLAVRKRKKNAIYSSRSKT